MISTEQLEHLIKLALLSSYVKDERPVSLLISARIESGKTEVIKKASTLRGVLYLNDVTAYGIQKHYLKRIANQEIRTIIIPDLLVPFAKQHSTVETFIAFMNGLLEEGTVGVATYAMHERLPVETRCNLITSTTRADLAKQRDKWTRVGFISRLIPVTYEYAPSTVYKIMRSIALREYQHESNFSQLTLPAYNMPIRLPGEVALQIEGLVPLLSKGLETYGFRLQKQLQTLCMSNALYNGRNVVEQIDFDIVSKLADHFNLDYKTI